VGTSQGRLSPRPDSANGEKDELVKETVTLRKKYGITTPTPPGSSFLMLLSPLSMRESGPGCRHGACDWRKPPVALAPTTPGAAPRPVVDFLKEQKDKKPEDQEAARARFCRGATWPTGTTGKGDGKAQGRSSGEETGL